MHYPFERGLIKEPAQYRARVDPGGRTLGARQDLGEDVLPAAQPRTTTELQPVESLRLSIAPGQQRNFVVQPTATRDYNFSTFGKSDTVMVLFEDVGGELRYLTGDDDSGEDRNASLPRASCQGRPQVRPAHSSLLRHELRRDLRHDVVSAGNCHQTDTQQDVAEPGSGSGYTRLPSRASCGQGSPPKQASHLFSEREKLR